jgi:F-type H+-transporting ATPase subunit a
MRVFAAAKPQIQIGVPPNFHLFGQTFDTYVIASTLVIAALMIVLVVMLRRSATSGAPGKLQMFFEAVVDYVRDLTGSVIGPEGEKYVPLGVLLFTFILLCNWIEFIPSQLQVGISPELLPPPTADINLPLAMALSVFLLCQVVAFRNRGFGGYFRHYTKPFAVLTPVNVIEEITKPITLTLRLFGNLFAGSLLLVVIAVVGDQLLGSIGSGVLVFGAAVVWKAFDTIFIGAIQALIFSLLTIMYLGMASATDH